MNSVSQLLEVEFVYTKSINYAIQQNKIPIVRIIKIKNLSDEELANLDIKITSIPAFTNSWSQKIDILLPKQCLEVNPSGITLMADMLTELTEQIVGEFILSVLVNEESIFEKKYEVNVLAFDQWSGTSTIPEILASFVTPNHPEIPKIIQKASKILEDWTNNPSFDAYQSRSRDRAKKQVGAIYEVIKSMEIIYCIPPASFEKEGQRIRMCDSVLSTKLGTCVDMTILFASCLEAIGINPLLIIVNGHAFVGAWLIDDSFADSVNYDVTLLKKRTATGINEILVAEATCLNAGHTSTFDEAVNIADHRLVNEEEFILFIDVVRARYCGIKPLPQRIKTRESWEIKSISEPINMGNQSPVEIVGGTDTEDYNIAKMSKQKIWERKLLDLSLRNSLLNLRVTQSTIQLLSVNLGGFEDALADAAEFQVLPKPDGWNNPDVVSGVFQTIGFSDPVVELLNHDLTHKRLRTYLTESELKSSITKLYRVSRLSLEENGANTLYLALGFLKWYETPQSELARYAPILLLPVEIIRKSAQVGYVIRGRDEDTIMNITLLEMLKQDFNIEINGLEELPTDKSGIDVRKVFNIIRRRIKFQAKWDLEEHAFLGVFSFNKFVMWNDISKNAIKFKESKVINSLMAGKLEWDATSEDKEDSSIDERYKPSDLLLPIEADSTQMEAICAANENKSFVLHGPPGTGKSQTITNIIANSLYRGKRVLFVAEKMAALTVVQKRLAEIGVAPFCLELHSNKAKKSNVLEQFRNITDLNKVSSPSEFLNESERLHNIKAELNQFVNALHKKYPFGYSLFDSFSICSNYSNIQENVHYDRTFIESLTKEKLVELCDIIDAAQLAGKLCGHPWNHSLREIKIIVYSQQNKSKARDILGKYLQSLNYSISLRTKISELFHIETAELSKENTEHYNNLLSLAMQLPDIPKAMLSYDNSERGLGNLAKLSNHGIKRDRFKSDILKTFTLKITEIEPEGLLREWNELQAKWFLPKYFGQRKINKILQSYSNGERIANNDVSKHLEGLILYQGEYNVVHNNPLQKDLDFLWNNEECNWQLILEICSKINEIDSLLLKITNDPHKTIATRKNLSELLSAGSRAFLESNGRVITEYLAYVNDLRKYELELIDLLEVDYESSHNGNYDYYSDLKDRASRWSENIELLKDWAGWNYAKKTIIDAGLVPFLKQYESGHIESDNLLAAFRRSIFRTFAEYIISSEKELSIFNGKMFEGKIAKFNEISKYFEQITRSELYSKLASRIPSFTNEAVNNSEVGILQKAIRNGGRGISLRKLFDSTPNLIKRMCPCMLMSPISVAQYFEVEKIKFDLIIFDEASQMPTSEAVGAIARGKDVIVVGDPKQMPPTSFFAINQYDEENAEIEDLESILDDCLALSMPSKYLLWHYRSKHESLIAFSNSKFYDNKLLTFPSPDDIKSKVSNVYVPGHYDRGKTRQNVFEAKAIVEDIIKRLSDPIESKKSIGVVTFSSVQQNLIEDLLSEEFKKDPEIEKIALDRDEPIFIKNLENVQGDERDVILFSVGYGPDKDGKIYFHFGPLIRRGGWRRLNVAISRARYEMKVFSTLRSDQIDISRTSSNEIIGFKAFLEYSERGKTVLTYSKDVKQITTSHFENNIAEEIRKKGYLVNTNIGCSGFRIDIGIINPQNTSEYILGILTDGYNYQSTKSAKDRDIVRIKVLKLLGWEIYRLWSREWWDNKDKILQEIFEKIENIMAYHKDNLKNEIADNHLNSKSPIGPLMSDYHNVNVSKDTTIVKKEETVYQIASLTPRSLYNIEEFYGSHILPIIEMQIMEVLNIEAPISRDMLSKRIIQAWGIGRMGSRLDEYLLKIYKHMKLKTSKQGKSTFYWNTEHDPDNYFIYRTPSEAGLKRTIDDIPKEEICNGIIEIIRIQFSLYSEDLVKEVSRLFGYSRITENIESAIKLGIYYATKKGRIVVKDDRYLLPE